ncbi:MAG: hypothetical protein PHC95_14605 [Parabacteroides sp.]|nr:hypothetical protein [Parabacteroides sp.]
MVKWYLENEYATQIDLQNEDVCIATAVTGLGMDTKSEYIGIGDHFIRNYLNPAMTALQLTLSFFNPSIYDKIQAVANFLVTAEKLFLVYQPGLSSGIVYRREVEVSSYLKDSAKDGYISYKLKLNPTSLFYYKKSTRFEISEMEGEKRYDFEWDAVFNDCANRTLSIPGGNHVDVAFSVVINGYTENPKIEIVSNEKTVHELVIPVTVQEGQFITYSSIDGDLLCTLTDASGNVTNLVNNFDLATNVFFKIPKAGATIQFTSDTDVMNTIVFTAYFFFKVV